MCSVPRRQAFHDARGLFAPGPMSSQMSPELSERDVLNVEALPGERFDATLTRKSVDRTLAKGERTRFLVLAQTARQLLDTPDRVPTVEGILDSTGLSRGTFYNYFADVDECIVVLLSTFMESLSQQRLSGGGDAEEDVVYLTNLWYCAAYSLNAGLFAAFSRISSEKSALIQMRAEINARWIERVVKSAGRRRGRPFVGNERKAFCGEVRLLGSMTIEALRERYVHRDPLLSSSFPEIDDMARGLTVVWNRTINHYVAS